MLRSTLILGLCALLGAAASAVLYTDVRQTRKAGAQQLAEANQRLAKQERDLAAAHEQAGTLKAKLTAAAAELAAANTKRNAAEARVEQLERDVTQVKTVLAVYEQTARALADEVAALRQDLTEARASQASPDAVTAYQSTIAELERQLAIARNGAVAPGTLASSTAVFSSRAGRAEVVNIGPENAFVVLNFGGARGAKLGQKLNVSQGTDLVATVLISDVRPNFSVAQVLPETLRGVLHKGDSAVLLR